MRAGARLAAAALLALAGCALPSSTLTVNGWVVSCAGVTTEVCQGVAEAFQNNLARGYEGVRQASGGRMSVAPLVACPPDVADLDWADPSACWKAEAPVPGSRACMIVARQNGVWQPTRVFGQAGGDEYGGRFGAPPPGTAPCG